MRSSNLISDTDLQRWSEEVMRKAAQQTNWYRLTTTVNCVAAQAEYSLPTDCISLEAVAHNSIPLDPITLDDLFAYDPYWRQTTATTPMFWYRRGFTNYALYPTPSTSITSGIQLIYVAIPAMPAGDSSTFNFPQANEACIIAYLNYRGALKMTPGEGEKKVQAYQQEYMAEMQRLKETVDALSLSELLVIGADSGRQSYPDQLARAIIPAPV